MSVVLVAKLMFPEKCKDFFIPDWPPLPPLNLKVTALTKGRASAPRLEEEEGNNNDKRTKDRAALGPGCSDEWRGVRAPKRS